MGEVQNIMPQSPWAGMEALQGNNNVNIDTYSDIQKKLNEYAARSQQQAAASNLQQAQYQKQLNELPVQTDLTPLMALSDAWSGSKLVQSYKPPTTAAERVGMMQKIQSEIDKNSANMDANQIKILKDQLDTQAQKENARDKLLGLLYSKEATAKSQQESKTQQNADRQQKQAAIEEERRIKHVDNATNGWLKDKTVIASKEKIAAGDDFDTLLDLAMSGNAQAAGALPTKLARMAGQTGVLTDRDVEIFSGSKALADRWNQAMETSKSGTLTPENAAFFKEVGDAFKAAAQENINKAAAEYAKIHSGRTKMTPEDLLTEMTGGTVPIEYLHKKEKPKTSAKSKSSSSGRVVGQVYEGYKYLGGPEDQESSYEEVK